MTRAGTAYLVAAGLLSFTSLACRGSETDDAGTAAPDGSSGRAGGTVLVAAAASLTDVIADLADAFEAVEPDVRIEASLGGSSSLVVAIEEGAPVDVFASANEEVMDRLVDDGLASDPIVFATNELVLAVPSGAAGGEVTSIDDVGRDDLFIGACASQVPCGAYTDDLLSRAGVDAAFDTRDGDVRAVVTKLVEGELDAGFVYRSDVAAFDDELDVIELSDDLRVVARYPVAALAEAPNRDGATAFVEFLTTDAAREVLDAAGFGAP